MYESLFFLKNYLNFLWIVIILEQHPEQSSFLAELEFRSNKLYAMLGLSEIHRDFD